MVGTLTTLRLWRMLTSVHIGGFFRRGSRKANGSARRPRRILRVAILPFEEQHSIDAARLENCKAVFAYEDVEDGKVKFFAACNYYPYRNPLLKKISEKYGVAGKYEPDKAEQPDTQKAEQEATA